LLAYTTPRKKILVVPFSLNTQHLILNTSL
jgi:hypothetical protein